ncbi:PTS sugar transporter subunit IIA [Gracilibacillus salinarum]|uniref:PTS glucose transporter subunit IIA n=1 Tax=Gracilibacillus salinarum TaxID=2932255 RepID=A0ABY4GGL9_9BACI|nr:PTS glucose transporter subunit IIA [Gracilibacillus salinarum]UOQ83470.1 PTS glucose transporter subunit IIA [Gracilibacillus salinarum]
MLKKLFGKREEKQWSVSVYAPVNGKVVPLEDVPDPVFAEKMMGEGVAIWPDHDLVVAPVNGTIIQLFPTKHAIGIQAENGAEILIHIGLETVGLKGEGFTSYVQEGDKVKVGEKLIGFDQSIIREQAASPIIPMIITNSAEMRDIKMKDGINQVTAGVEEIIHINK